MKLIWILNSHPNYENKFILIWNWHKLENFMTKKFIDWVGGNMELSLLECLNSFRWRKHFLRWKIISHNQQRKFLKTKPSCWFSHQSQHTLNTHLSKVLKLSSQNHLNLRIESLFAWLIIQSCRKLISATFTQINEKVFNCWLSEGFLLIFDENFAPTNQRNIPKSTFCSHKSAGNFCNNENIFCMLNSFFTIEKGCPSRWIGSE